MYYTRFLATFFYSQTTKKCAFKNPAIYSIFQDFKLSFAMKKLSCLGILAEFFRFLDLSFVKILYVVDREETFSFLALIRSASCVNSL